MFPDGAESKPRATNVRPRKRLPGATSVLVQFLKFGIVGVSNTLLTLAVYTLLLKVAGVWYLAASAIGFTAGAVNGFLLNRRWTFRGHVGDAFTPVRYVVVQGCGLGLNEGLLQQPVHRPRGDPQVEARLGRLATEPVEPAQQYRHR